MRDTRLFEGTAILFSFRPPPRGIPTVYDPPPVSSHPMDPTFPSHVLDRACETYQSYRAAWTAAPVRTGEETGGGLRHDGRRRPLRGAPRQERPPGVRERPQPRQLPRSEGQRLQKQGVLLSASETRTCCLCSCRCRRRRRR